MAGTRFFVRLQTDDPTGSPRDRVWELTVTAENSTAAPVEAMVLLKKHAHVSPLAVCAQVVYVEERPPLSLRGPSLPPPYLRRRC